MCDFDDLKKPCQWLAAVSEAPSLWSLLVFNYLFIYVELQGSEDSASQAIAQSIVMARSQDRLLSACCSN